MFSLFRRTPPISLVDTEHWQNMLHQMPLLSGLNAAERERLTERVRYFLKHKSMVAARGFKINDHMRLTIAAQACLPIMNLENEAYDDWLGVIIYPDAFWSEEKWTDEFGLVHEGVRASAGLARGDGPVLVSWRDSQSNAQLNGYSVVIHECAHKLDMRNGDANGSPPLHAGMSQPEWTSIFRRSFADFRLKARMGVALPFNDYGATNPAEFFAVASEAFFETPHSLASAYPDVYAQLALFYRQDPRSRLPEPEPQWQEAEENIH